MGNRNPLIERVKEHVLLDDNIFYVDIERSNDSFIVDKNTGKTYLDCFSQFASQPLGWNNDKLLSRISKAYNASIQKIANSDMITDEYIEFVDTFSKYTKDFQFHFYIDGGASAVENALKTAFDWKCRQMAMNNNTNPEYIDTSCLNIIHFKEAFHGRSGYTLSLTNNSYDNTKVKLFPKFKWSRVLNPKLQFPTQENIEEIETHALNRVESFLVNGNTAAVLIEPIQGEGGDNHFRSHFLRKLKELADEYAALLIFDEVQTGVGLTGSMWAYQQLETIPDILVFGKKMQVCGCLCRNTEKFSSVGTHVFNEHSRLNSTWGGNLVDMVRATLFLNIIEEDKLIENAKNVGEYFINKLSNFGLKNLRGRGLMIAFDLDSKEERNKFVENITQEILLLPCGEKSVRLRPHLTFKKDHVDLFVDILQKYL